MVRFGVILLAGWLLPAAALGASGVEIIGHRGASYDAPENTLPSIELAWERDADAVEIDVFLTADGEIVASHDENTKRTAGRDKLVVEQTLAELRTLDAGAWKSAKYAGTTIPTLSEVLATIPPGKRLVVEIKCGPEAAEPLQKVIWASGKQDQVLFISFQFDAVVAAKQRMPSIPSYWLYGFRSAENRAHGLKDALGAIAKVKDAGLDGIDVNYMGVDENFMAAAKAAKLPVVVYTVNSPAVAKKLAAMGVVGITTDRPGYMRTELGTTGQ